LTRMVFEGPIFYRFQISSSLFGLMVAVNVGSGHFMFMCLVV